MNLKAKQAMELTKSINRIAAALEYRIKTEKPACLSCYYRNPKEPPTRRCRRKGMLGRIRKDVFEGGCIHWKIKTYPFEEEKT